MCHFFHGVSSFCFTGASRFDVFKSITRLIVESEILGMNKGRRHGRHEVRQNDARALFFEYDDVSCATLTQDSINDYSLFQGIQQPLAWVLMQSYKGFKCRLREDQSEACTFVPVSSNLDIESVELDSNRGWNSMRRRT